MQKREKIDRFEFTGYPFQPGEKREVNCMPQVPFHGKGFEIPEGLKRKFLVHDIRVGVSSIFANAPREPIALENFAGMNIDLEPAIPGICVTFVLECIAKEPTMFKDVFLLGEEVEYDTIGSIPLRVPFGHGRMAGFANILRLLADEIEATERTSFYGGLRRRS